MTQILDFPPASLPPAQRRVTIVTGLSDPSTTRLHPTQIEFLKSLPLPESNKLYRNFPFIDPESTILPWPTLLKACAANARQFLSSQTSRFRQQAAPHWRSLIESSNQTLLIVGSCGQQLLDGIPDDLHNRNIGILALGPVRLGRSPLKTHNIIGRRDWISRCTLPSIDEPIKGLGHLGYWYNSEVKERTTHWLLSNISGSQAPAATCLNGD